MHLGFSRSGMGMLRMKHLSIDLESVFSARSLEPGMYPTQFSGTWKWKTPTLPFCRYQVFTISRRFNGSLVSLLSVPSRASRPGIVITYSVIDLLRSDLFRYSEDSIADSFAAFLRHVRDLGADGHFCFYIGRRSARCNWFQAHRVVGGESIVPPCDFAKEVFEFASGFIFLILTEFTCGAED